MRGEVIIRLNMPDELTSFRFPEALDRRLQHLLDKQDQGEPLTPEERLEAEGLVDLAESLSLLRIKAEIADRETARPS